MANVPHACMNREPRPRRRFLRVGLRTFLVFIALMAVGLAWVAKERRQSAWEVRLAEELQKGGGFAFLVGRYDTRDSVNSRRGSIWRPYLGRILGQRIGTATICTTNNEDIRSISDLTNLFVLQIVHSGGADIDLTPVSSQKKLFLLILEECPVRDLSPLTSLHDLRELMISSPNLTDLSPLTKLRRLESLTLSDCTSVTHEEVTKLKEALPNCRVTVGKGLTPRGRYKSQL